MNRTATGNVHAKAAAAEAMMSCVTRTATSTSTSDTSTNSTNAPASATPPTVFLTPKPNPPPPLLLSPPLLFPHTDQQEPELEHIPPCDIGTGDVAGFIPHIAFPSLENENDSHNDYGDSNHMAHPPRRRFILAPRNKLPFNCNPQRHAHTSLHNQHSGSSNN